MLCGLGLLQAFVCVISKYDYYPSRANNCHKLIGKETYNVLIITLVCRIVISTVAQLQKASFMHKLQTSVKESGITIWWNSNE